MVTVTATRPICEEEDQLESGNSFQIVAPTKESAIDFEQSLYPGGSSTSTVETTIRITPQTFKLPFTLVDLMFEISGVSEVKITLIDELGTDDTYSPQKVIFNMVLI